MSVSQWMELEDGGEENNSPKTTLELHYELLQEF